VKPHLLRQKILHLKAIHPITARFESAIAQRDSRKKDPWCGRQKEHWLGWLKDYNGPGYYDRRSWDVTAETVYNRVVNPSMVLWLCEAAGVPKSIIEDASSAALAGSQTMAAQSGAIRRVIRWGMIEERL